MSTVCQVLGNSSEQRDKKSCPHLPYKAVGRRTQAINYISRICTELDRGVGVRGDIAILNMIIREGLTGKGIA